LVYKANWNRRVKTEIVVKKGFQAVLTLDGVNGFSRVLVCLDANHTHDHVLAELDAYAPLISKGSYCIVFDTLIEDLPVDTFPDRPWNPGNNPKTAVYAYLEKLKKEDCRGADSQQLRFEIDEIMEEKLGLNVTPSGFLMRL